MEVEVFLYSRIVSQFETQIKQELLKPGDKLPSLRTLSQEQGISISTAYKAYIELEHIGLIEARFKSGYYVKFPKIQFSKSIIIKPPLISARPTKVGEMVRMIYESLSGEGVLSLSIAGPSISLLPVAALNKSMIEATRKSPSGNAYYENKEGNVQLRKQIAKHSIRSGVSCTENDIITTHGANEAILFCLLATTQPGDIVAIESPAYFSIFNIMLSLGLEVLEIPVNYENGLDIDYLQEAMQRVKISACLFIPNFNNPIGCSMTDDRKQRLVKLLNEKQIPLIEDDVCGDIFFGKSRPRTCKSFDTNGMVLLCSSITKSIAPGYRVGWCIPGRYKELVTQFKMIHSITSTTPTQLAIANFFETGRYERHIRDLRKALHIQCHQYISAIATYFPADTKISRPQGGYSLWVELNANVNAFDLYYAAIAHHISIAPGQIFSIDSRFTNFIRISFGTPYTKNIENSFKILGDLIQNLIN